MNIGKWLKKNIITLDDTGISTARLDAEILLADILHKDRSWVLAHPEHTLRKQTIQKLDGQINRRSQHEPLAYIREKQEFFGREFTVSPDTLTPRPETETMVELLLDEVGSKNWDEKKMKEKEPTTYNLQLTTSNSPSLVTIIDVGTGSGCIIITAALELAKNFSPHSSPFQLIGLDISPRALRIARKNKTTHGADVTFKKIDLTKERLPLHPTSYTFITANLPYVPNDFHINLAASHEPKFAIFGGNDGLDYYRALFSQLKTTDRQPPTDSCTVLTESLPPQHKELESIAKKARFKLHKSHDFIQLFKR